MKSSGLRPVFLLGAMLALILAACGQPASPTATPVPPTQATTGPTPVPAQSPIRPPTASPGGAGPAGTVTAATSGYPPERVKEMIAQNMYLPGMSFGQDETPQYGGVANYSNKRDPQNDDPMLSSSITVRTPWTPVTGEGGLVIYDRQHNDQPAPYLAQSWTLSDDFMTWTFKLRPDVKWHDGSPLVAEDIKWYMELGVNPPEGRRRSSRWAATLVNLKEVQAPDEHTIRLVFDAPSPHLLEELSSYGNAIAHKRDLGQAEIDKGNVRFGMVALGGVGLGPFKWSEYVKGSHIKTVRNDQYFEKDEAGRALPYLDGTYVPIIADTNVALAAFRAGRIDAMSRGIGASPDAEGIKLIERSLAGKVYYHRYPYLNNGLSMNIRKPPFDDVRVRRAVTLYMDRDDGCVTMYGGFCYGTGFTVPGVYWYSGAYVDWPGFSAENKERDKAEALRLIQEAGVAGMKVEQSSRNDYLFNMEFNEQVLRDLGFEVTIKSMDLQANTDYGLRDQWHTSTGGSPSGGFPTPVLATNISSMADSDSYKWNDPKIDAWYETILTSVDPIERRNALWAAERHWFVDMVYTAPFWREEVIQPYRTYLKGSIVPGWAAHANQDMSRDWIDKSLR